MIYDNDSLIPVKKYGNKQIERHTKKLAMIFKKYRYAPGIFKNSKRYLINNFRYDNNRTQKSFKNASHPQLEI